MAGSRSIVSKLLIFAFALALSFGFQMWRNGTAQKYVARYLHGKEGKAFVDAPPEVSELIDDSLHRAQTAGKTPVIRFNLVNCGICERVSRDVFTKPEWGKFAAEKLEITEYLMPTTVTSDDPEMVKRMNLLIALGEAAGVQGGFPLFVVMGKDGSVLGARAGYHAGGASGYINWVEGLVKADTSVAKVTTDNKVNTSEPTEPAKAPVTKVVDAPKVSTPAAAPVPATNEMVKASLDIAVKGVSGTGASKVVLLAIGERNYPLFSGDKKRVQFNNAPVLVECREISDDEIVVQVEGEEKERRLSLKLE